MIQIIAVVVMLSQHALGGSTLVTGWGGERRRGVGEQGINKMSEQLFFKQDCKGGRWLPVSQARRHESHPETLTCQHPASLGGGERRQALEVPNVRLCLWR